MNAEEKFELVKRNTEEILGEEDLKKLLESKEKLKHYIGFEISGKIHLGSGLMSMLKVKDFMDAGIDCSVFLADWHTWINDKLGGNPEIIKKIAVGYFKEGIMASLKCVGGDPKKLKFVLGSDLYHNNDTYWETVIDVSKHTSLSRIQRSITIMGRKEEGNVDFAKMIYPPMQVADIFIQQINIAHAGLDQRKAQVIAIDVAPKLSFCPLINKKGEQIKPIAIHHKLILGLGKPSEWPIKKENIQEIWSSLKMSKSKPDTCIFIHDSTEEIKRKISKAFCPEKETEFNPILDWAKSFIFPIKDKLQLKRDEKFGGNKLYNSYHELEKDFANGKLHPMDLKNAVADSLIEILEPAREHFSKGAPKKMLDELDKLLKEFA
ncbi:MAG: tyrosine--tRNA ligase [Candidatus Nanoarchaeia archaeon]|nr:tyrosine--tRNA ligase [Candidatus Nanoarchaeia archaeon]MDD5358058.1 tyrosine--tRNA ligase [Candidatus Nanoarchaeia archaeon]MDD5589246.1 tyrosine--tRNA ligase [Candidatus Nanoarchaeia archaeon]